MYITWTLLIVFPTTLKGISVLLQVIYEPYIKYTVETAHGVLKLSYLIAVSE
jgi:hypothetical protein